MNYELGITNIDKNKRMLLFLVILFSVCILLTSLPKAHAQDKGIPPVILSVSPVLLSITLSPDQTTEYPITLTNQLDSPLPVKVNFADFKTATEDGGYQFVDTKTDPLLSWVSAPEDVFILQPQEKKEVRIVVKTPKTIPFGGYYGMVYFEPILPSASGQTKVLAKIAVLMLGSVGISDPNATNAQILTFQTPTMLQADKTLPLLLRVKNTSINHFSAKPFVTVQSLFGKTTTYQLEDKYVFPSKVRRWQEAIDTNMHTGIYMVKAAVSVGNGKQLFMDTMVIVYPTNGTLMLIGLLLVILIAVIYRNRIRKALTILVFDKKAGEKKTTIVSPRRPIKKIASKKKKKALDSRSEN